MPANSRITESGKTEICAPHRRPRTNTAARDGNMSFPHVLGRREDSADMLSYDPGKLLSHFLDHGTLFSFHHDPQ
jgi:hypothetical protein